MGAPPGPRSNIARQVLRTQGSGPRLLGLAFALCAPLLAGPRAAAEPLAEWISGFTRFYNERSDLQLPPLDGGQLRALERGEVVQYLRREPRPGASGETDDRVVGMLLVQEPMADTWLAALDPDLPVGEIYHDARLWHDGSGNSRWVVLLDLPWPLADRYWAVDLTKSVELARASEGRLWEHRWELSADGPEIARKAVREGKLPGIDEARLDGAIYTPVNRGGIVTAQLGEHGTLLLYHLSTVVGGIIPDALVRTISQREVRHFLEQTAQRSRAIREHYDSAHEDVYGGDGLPIVR